MEVVRNITNILVSEKKGSVVKPRTIPLTAKKASLPGSTGNGTKNTTNKKIRTSKSDSNTTTTSKITVNKVRASKSDSVKPKPRSSQPQATAQKKPSTSKRSSDIAVGKPKRATGSGSATNRTQKPASAPTAAQNKSKAVEKVKKEAGKLEDGGPGSDLHEEKMVTLKEIVTQAELDRKIFCIFENHRYIAQPVREELLARGWLEFRPDRDTIPRRQRPPPPTKTDPPAKIDHTTLAVLQTPTGMTGGVLHVTPPDPSAGPHSTNDHILEYGLKHEVRAPAHHSTPLAHPKISEKLQAVSEIIQEINGTISFVWLSSKPDVQLPYFPYTPLIANKFQRTTFCSKYGLWHNLQATEQLPKNIRFPLKTPRMYDLGDNQSNADFVFDFYTTAATSLLRWLVTNLANKGVDAVQNSNGKVPQRVFEFAILKCKLLARHLRPRATVTREDVIHSESNWLTFLQWFYKITNEDHRMKPTPTVNLYLLHSRAVEVLRSLSALRPGTDSDGTCNLWIVKPYSAACGRGIFITNNIEYMNQISHKRYIIQKYIERPHLIEHTKFDIRQWFLLTSLRPLQVWIYKESYLRFCALPFDLRNLHESIHLSNNAIQRKYNSKVGLPHQNMWDSKTFQAYLTRIGQGELWAKQIFPGMRDGISSALLRSQHSFDEERPSGWFEVYGADFMLTHNLREGPWLIEINESPAMDPSTPITQRLCQQMLRDVIKVVVDLKKNPDADTGGWELAYNQQSD